LNAHQHAGAAARLEVHVEQKSFSSATGERIDVLRDLHFDVPENRFACIFGPSGCGKTTILRILMGLDGDYGGSVRLPNWPDPRVGAVFQEPTLLPWRSVEQNIRLALPGHRKDANLDPLLEILGLDHLRSFYPGELSLGLARRVAIARALAIEPDVLLLDEPFVSLDQALAQQLRNLLLSVWSERPTTALMVTHDLDEAIMLSDRIIVLSPRPAKVVGMFDITVPRRERDEKARDDLRRSFRKQFLAPEPGP
jgi:NitT/TauT family transport system ATP-binding protein